MVIKKDTVILSYSHDKEDQLEFRDPKDELHVIVWKRKETSHVKTNISDLHFGEDSWQANLSTKGYEKVQIKFNDSKRAVVCLSHNEYGYFPQDCAYSIYDFEKSLVMTFSNNYKSSHINPNSKLILYPLEKTENSFKCILVVQSDESYSVPFTEEVVFEKQKPLDENQIENVKNKLISKWTFDHFVELNFSFGWDDTLTSFNYAIDFKSNNKYEIALTSTGSYYSGIDNNDQVESGKITYFEEGKWEVSKNGEQIVLTTFSEEINEFYSYRLAINKLTDNKMLLSLPLRASDSYESGWYEIKMKLNKE